MFYQVSVFHRYLQDYENFVIFASDISQATDRARRLCSPAEIVCGIVSLGDNPQTVTRGHHLPPSVPYTSISSQETS